MQKEGTLRMAAAFRRSQTIIQFSMFDPHTLTTIEFSSVQWKTFKSVHSLHPMGKSFKNNSNNNNNPNWLNVFGNFAPICLKSLKQFNSPIWLFRWTNNLLQIKCVVKWANKFELKCVVLVNYKWYLCLLGNWVEAPHNQTQKYFSWEIISFVMNFSITNTPFKYRWLTVHLL